MKEKSKPTQKKVKKPVFPQKGKIVLLLKDGIVVAGDGYIEAVKNTKGEFIFTGTLVKDYSLPKSKQ